MLTIMLMSTALLLLPFKPSNFSWATTLSSLFIMSLLMIVKPSSFIFSKASINQFLTVDYMSLPLIFLTILISALMLLASFSIKIKNNSKAVFLIMILSLNFILITTFCASNVLMFYISFEATLIPTLLIILGWGYQPERLQAGFYLMIYTVAASLPLLISLFLMFKANSTLSFNHNMWTSPANLHLSQMWWIMTIMAFMTKMPLYTLHLWLPKAHVEAPVAGSMILAGLLLKLGSYGILRMASLFPDLNKTLSSIITSIALWGAIVTSMICLRQTDMKSLIAYSSVGHMALLTAGMMSSTMWGWESAMMMMMAHGLCSSAMFALANMQYEATQTRSIYLTKGMLSFFPIMSMLWFITSSANMAAPPSLNLISEIILISSILSKNMVAAPLLAMTAFLSAAYSLFLFTTTQHGSPSNFINPLTLFTSRNYITIIIHITPLFLLCLKTDLFMAWLL